MSAFASLDSRIAALADRGVRITNFGFDDDDDEVRVTYEGHPENLVAVGVATAELLAPGKKGIPKLDADGDRCRVERSYRGRRLVRVYFSKPVARALRLPGFGIEFWLERFRRPPARSP